TAENGSSPAGARPSVRASHRAHARPAAGPGPYAAHSRARARGNRLSTWAEDEMYADPVVFTQTTPYRRIVVTRDRAGFQLFLNGNLQFASADSTATTRRWFTRR